MLLTSALVFTVLTRFDHSNRYEFVIFNQGDRPFVEMDIVTGPSSNPVPTLPPPNWVYDFDDSSLVYYSGLDGVPPRGTDIPPGGDLAFGFSTDYAITSFDLTTWFASEGIFGYTPISQHVDFSDPRLISAIRMPVYGSGHASVPVPEPAFLSAFAVLLIRRRK